MVRHLLHLVVAAAILLMFLPPVFDTFDSWDRRPEIPVAGHNTETTLVLVSADLGLCAVVAWTALRFLDWLVALFAPYLLQIFPAPFRPLARATDYLLLLFSPPAPPLSLRI